jgi:hypothetical protein
MWIILTYFVAQSNYQAILGQALEASFQVIPAAEPESRAKTILFFLCLIL